MSHKVLRPFIECLIRSFDLRVCVFNYLGKIIAVYKQNEKENNEIKNK